MRDQYPLPQLLLKALRATGELLRGRIALGRIKPNDVLERNRRVAVRLSGSAPRTSSANVARSTAEAAFFINRMAARVPWRADCLVQALAGQNWLAREGIISEIVVGTAKRPDGTFESHAWLRQQGRIVLGGDISTYQPLLDPDGGFQFPD